MKVVPEESKEQVGQALINLQNVRDRHSEAEEG